MQQSLLALPRWYAARLHISHFDSSRCGIHRCLSTMKTLDPDAVALPAQKEDPSDGVLRLMPLGGSVTRGVGSSQGTGYRKLLLQLLEEEGLNARMVGSRKDGMMPNNDHEGWRGFRIDEIERKAKKSVEGLSPDVFLVNAGSNDCLQAFETANAGARMSQMLDFLWQTCPQSTILLSTLLVNADKQVDSVVRDFNFQFRALVEKKAYEQKRIVLVDMYSPEGPDAQSLVDGIHPDDDGYDKMTRLWFDGIQKAIHKGFIRQAKYSR